MPHAFGARAASARTERAPRERPRAASAPLDCRLRAQGLLQPPRVIAKRRRARQRRRRGTDSEATEAEAVAAEEEAAADDNDADKASNGRASAGSSSPAASRGAKSAALAHTPSVNCRTSAPRGGSRRQRAELSMLWRWASSAKTTARSQTTRGRASAGACRGGACLSTTAHPRSGPALLCCSADAFTNHCGRNENAAREVREMKPVTGGASVTTRNVAMTRPPAPTPNSSCTLSNGSCSSTYQR